jgi:hypothetical protein
LDADAATFYQPTVRLLCSTEDFETSRPARRAAEEACERGDA